MSDDIDRLTWENLWETEDERDSLRVENGELREAVSTLRGVVQALESLCDETERALTDKGVALTTARLTPKLCTEDIRAALAAAADAPQPEKGDQR